MKPGAMMWLGAFSAVVAFVVSFAVPAVNPVMLAFAGGMLFGKGYGIWEERAL